MIAPLLLAAAALGQVWPLQPTFAAPTAHLDGGLWRLHESYLRRSLQWDEGLAGLAMATAQRCAQTGQMRHSGANVWENLAWCDSAETAMWMWARDRAHASNLRAPWTRFGAAYADGPYGRFWCACYR